jgi:6-pyruvoyltetrahydropterin/6-carboxytetrahydropterin synthase
VVLLKVRVGIEGLSFDAAHYTRHSTSKCLNLHGHTYTVNVEVYGEINRETGMVIDFLVLKKKVKEILDEYDHKIIVPRRDMDKITIKGPFNTMLKPIDYPEATTEYIALDIARRIHEAVKLPVKVRVYEGRSNYAEAVWEGE